MVSALGVPKSKYKQLLIEKKINRIKELLPDGGYGLASRSRRFNPGKRPPEPNEQDAGRVPEPVVTLLESYKYDIPAGNRTTYPEQSSLWPSHNTGYVISAPEYGTLTQLKIA
jgi:hypothetical protein